MGKAQANPALAFHKQQKEKQKQKNKKDRSEKREVERLGADGLTVEEIQSKLTRLKELHIKPNAKIPPAIQSEISKLEKLAIWTSRQKSQNKFLDDQVADSGDLHGDSDEEEEYDKDIRADRLKTVGGMTRSEIEKVKEQRQLKSGARLWTQEAELERQRKRLKVSADVPEDAEEDEDEDEDRDDDRNERDEKKRDEETLNGVGGKHSSAVHIQSDNSGSDSDDDILPPPRLPPPSAPDHSAMTQFPTPSNQTDNFTSLDFVPHGPRITPRRSGFTPLNNNSLHDITLATGGFLPPLPPSDVPPPPVFSEMGFSPLPVVEAPPSISSAPVLAPPLKSKVSPVGKHVNLFVPTSVRITSNLKSDTVTVDRTKLDRLGSKEKDNLFSEFLAEIGETEK